MYSITNFIVPNFTENRTLKIRNVNNIVTHIIKENKCTITVNNNTLIILQNGDSNPIQLTFDTRSNATTAHQLLRNALKSLEPVDSTSTGSFIKTFNPNINTTIFTDSDIIVPFDLTVIKKLYVCGVLIPNDITIRYVLNPTNPKTITWKAVNDFILEIDDEITLEYF